MQEWSVQSQDVKSPSTAQTLMQSLLSSLLTICILSKRWRLIINLEVAN